MQESNYWKRLRSARMTRRYLLRGTATTAAGGAAALIVGCGGGGASGPSFTPCPDCDPMPGGTITQGRSISALGIDPHVDLTGLDIDLLIYSYLYGWAPDAEEAVFNNLAESLEIIDDVTFNYTVRRGVKVHPISPVGAGEEMTAEDCKQSIVRRGTSISAPDKRITTYIAGQVDRTLLDAAIDVIDPQHFTFTMSEPFVPALREMANPTWAMVPAKVMEEFLSLSQDAYGSGPFMLTEFRGTERIVLEKNPDYFIPDRPYLDGVTYIIITENSSLLTAFKSGQHDVNGSFLTRKDADSLMEDDRIQVAGAPSDFYPCIHLKMRPPFDDIRVRKAINYALNRDEFIEGLQNGEGAYNGPIQWTQEKWALPQEELRDFYQYRPDEAKALLSDAGYENGFSTKMKIPALPGIDFVADYALLIKDQLSRVGIDVQIDEVELGAFIGSVILPGNFDMAFFPNLPYDEPDRPLAFYHSLGVTGNGNWTNYTNPELDKLIAAQAGEFDFEKRQQIILDAQRMILEEHGPQLTLTGGFQFAARWKYVHYPFEFYEDNLGNPTGVDIWRQPIEA
jgi:peptide/nickel transport system substrate-binding protein